MGEPEEFKHETKVTIGLIVWAVAIAFSMGYLYATMYLNDKRQDANSNSNRMFTEQEVGGLRADWERENKEIHRRLEKLEQYHTK